MRVIQLVAPCPGLFTGAGTNTWVLEIDGEALIIDPGPNVDRHIRAVLAAVDGLAPVGVAVTHAHPDHAPAAHTLATALEAPVLAFLPGPGVRPDRTLADGDEIEVGSVRVRAMHTPGHTPDHLAFCVASAMFTGDHVINAEATLIEHLPEYLESLGRMAGRGLQVLFPGHGNPMRDPDAVIETQLAGIRDREERIIASLTDGARSVGEIVERVYPGLDRTLYFSTAENVGAHLRKLSGDGMVALPEASVEWSARVVLVGSDQEQG